MVVHSRGQELKKLDLGQTVTILANVGVIAGIVFLGFELQQNNKQLELQSYQGWVTANLQLNMALTDPTLSEIIALGNIDSANLSEGSFVSFAMWNMGVMQMVQAVDYLYRSGSLDRNLWEAEINRAAGILSVPGVRQWWDAGGKTQLTPQFAELMESTQSSIAYWDWDADRGFFSNDEIVTPREP